MDNKLLLKFRDFSIGPIGAAFISFVMTPVFTSFISPAEYGKANMFAVVITIAQLIVFLGMDQAYSKRYYYSDNKNQLLINAIFPSFVVILIVELIVFIFKNEFAVFLFGTSKETLCIYCLMIILPFLDIERFFMLTLRMDQRGKAYSLMIILLKLLILTFTVMFFLFAERSYRAIVFGNTSAQIVFCFLLVALQKDSIKLDFRELESNAIMGMLRFGLPLVPTTIIGWVLNGMDKVMLRSLSNYESIGIYSVAATIAAVLTIIQSSFTTFWTPLAHQWYSEGQRNNKYVSVGNIISFFMIECLLLVLIFKRVLFLLFRPDYLNAISVLPFLLIVPVMYTISEVPVMGLYFKEKTGWTVLVSVVSASINLTLNYLLIPILGAQGAAVATGLSYIVFFWCRTLISRRLWFAFPIKKYVLLTITVVCICGLNMCITGIGIYISNVIAMIIMAFCYKEEIVRCIEMIGLKKKETK